MAKDRRIFGGYYKRYDGKMFFVVTVAKDYDTGEETVVFFDITYTKKFEYLTMSKKEFCESVEWKGRKVKKFTRQTQMSNQGWIWDEVMDDGFEGVHRVYKPRREYDFDDLYYRTLRNSRTYADYAKDLCKNYVSDRNKVNFCIENKRYIGISKEDFTILNTDYRFMTTCFDTVLLEYKDYFTERYIDKVSIRKYATAHNMSRGSVEHIERKMLQQLALELKLRDDNDNKVRIKTVTEDEE